jgi:SAM-dependent methyltransferase
MTNEETMPESEAPSEPDETRPFYDESAQAYAESTLAADLRPTWELLTSSLRPDALILDLGCGAGRDLKYFAERGYRVVGVDYSRALVEIARRHSGQPVELMDFRSLDFPEDTFDAVWAIASLLHLARADIDQVLGQIRRVLKPGGLFVASMKKGHGERVDERGRFFSEYLPDQWRDRLAAAGSCRIQIREDLEERNVEEGRTISITWLVSFCMNGDKPKS